MSEIFVKHTLNPRKAVKFNLHLRKYTLTDTEGETVWLLEIGTVEPDLNGDPIPPKYVHKLTDDALEDAINKAVAEICSLIDWGEFDIDRYPPLVSTFSPLGLNVPISSVINFKLIEEFPASGIDLTDMVVTLNNGEVDFDITSELVIKGDPYEYDFQWIPTILYG